MLVAVLGLTMLNAPPVGARERASAAPIDAREVPLLPGQGAARPSAAPVKAEFAPLASRSGGAGHFDPKTSRPVSRTMFSEEYANADGTRTVRQSSLPLNVADAEGRWHPVDTALRRTPSGRLAATAQPLAPSVAGSAADPAVVSVEVDGARASLGLEQAAPSPARVQGNRANYADVLPDTDLDYEVTPGSVKETLLLKRPPAQATWRFRLATTGLTPRVAADGTVRFTDARSVLKLVMPPVEAWDSSGDASHAPAQSGGGYRLERAGEGWVLTVSVDTAWLRDPKRVYPVHVDPTFSFGVLDSQSYRSDGYVCGNCGLRIGNSQNNGDSYNRTAVQFDFSPLYGKTVVGARVDLTRNTSVVGSLKTWNADLFHASALDYNGLGAHLASALVGDVGSFSSPELTGFLKHVVDIRQPSYFMLLGSEVAGTWTYKDLNATLVVDTGTAPPAANLAGPADNSVLTTLTPTLAVSPVTDPDGDPTSYCFKVATGPDARSGVVVDSGCLASPTWTVPAGVLQDGGTYTWQATTYSGISTTAPPWVGHFKVDQRIGARGPSPVDTLGPFTVNLANGNLSTQVSGPEFSTVAGKAGLSLTYNSQQAELKGLKASYFVDLSHNGLINDAQQPVLVRTEPQVNVNWDTGSPFPPAMSADWYVVRWEGYFQAPATGGYQFAGVHDDGATVWINGAKVYGVSGPSDVNWTESTMVNLTAGQRVPIKVELAEATGAAKMRLFTRTADGVTVPAQIVSADWLYSADLPALSRGWVLSSDVDGDGSAYTEAKIADQSIVLTDGTGAKHTWTKTSAGGYSPPDGEVGVLALDTGGRVTLTEGSDVFTFRADGNLDAQTSVADSRKPATLQNLYDGTPSRLREIKDPVSGRSHVLHYNRAGDDCYGGATVPPGADRLPPSQMLCRVTYWDGSETRLWYVGGNLSRVEDPGSEITDFGYTAQGLLNGLRDARAGDWIAADPATRKANEGDITAIVTYDGAAKAKVLGVASAVPAIGTPRQGRTYRYDPAGRQTFVDVAGLSPAQGFATKVTFDDADRTLSTTDATGRTTRQSWNVRDQELTSSDPAGRMTTKVYDQADRLTDTYGPAPASCFSGQLPTAACANTVPHEHSGFDEGINGLSVAYYANDSLTGAPKVFSTGIGEATGKLARNWDTAAPADGIPADHFSLRATGEIVFPQAGDYTLRVLADDGLRVWIDDRNVIDDWRNTAPAWRQATVHSDAAGSIKRIRLDYYEFDVTAQLELHWTTPGGLQEQVPGTVLRPRYGLTTSTVTAESGGVPDRVSATRYTGLDPAYGQATSIVADPAGLGLTQGFGFEPVGNGYLRKTSRTLPAGTQTGYSYYGDGEARANPCVTGSPSVNQGGLAKLTAGTTPATGPARVDEQVYDAAGRVVAKATANQWSCLSYDARGRVTQQTYPANPSAGARTVTRDHAVGGDPLTNSVADQNGTVTTTVDLLGRVVRYVDANGTDTVTTYDRAGRATRIWSDPSLSNDAPRVTTTAYDDAGRVVTVEVDGVTQATASYDAGGELAGVTYSNRAALTGTGRDAAGRTTSLTWKLSDGRTIVSAVTRSRAGTVTDESLGGVDANPAGPNYVYDAAGRMTEAYVTGHHLTYDYSSASPGACPAGTQPTAGRNSNRIRLLDQTTAGTAETGYCYDNADRLLATTGATTATGFTYDNHGNTTAYTVGGSTTRLGFDAADRNISLSTTGSGAADVSYVRDATDRIVRRDARQGDEQDAVLYGYAGDGDAAVATFDTDHHVLTWTQVLPGGVVWTEQNSQAPDNWDLPTVRGDLFATVQNGGLTVGDVQAYDPYGQPLTTAGGLDNQPGRFDFGWLGQYQRPYEHAGALSIMEMGDRPYSPLFGRFLSVDPVEGGSANDYDYVMGDPVNKTDLDGNSCRRNWYSRTCTTIRFRWTRFSVRTVTRTVWGSTIDREREYRLGRAGLRSGWILDSEITCTQNRGARKSCSIYQPHATKIKRNWPCFGGFLAFGGGLIATAATNGAFAPLLGATMIGVNGVLASCR
ncbi:PA14 domain-containing protein [Dactylosporangium sp. CA-092794]|uniref:PA14 domain-containing protein n=1 Tax=Dactylosporangium sp. CA-092794 TaxID=3239929 RepID=UPI003D8DDC33